MYYISIICSSFIISIKKNFEYKINAIMVVVDQLLDVLAIWLFWISLLSLNITIEIWGKKDIFIFVGFSLLSSSVSNLFVGTSDLKEHIINGTLDLYLIKPANAIFLIALERCNFLRFVTTFPISLITIFASAQTTPIANVVLAIFISIIATITLELIRIIPSVLGFYLLRTRNLSLVLDLFLSFKRYPVHVFGSLSGKIFTYILPVAFIATIPTDFVAKRTEISLLSIALVIFLLSVLVVKKLWEKGKVRYESAN